MLDDCCGPESVFLVLSVLQIMEWHCSDLLHQGYRVTFSDIGFCETVYVLQENTMTQPR